MQVRYLHSLTDDGKALRALQSSLADAKVEVEFWKRKVNYTALDAKFVVSDLSKVDDLSTRLTESQIERRLGCPPPPVCLNALS